MKLTAIDPQRCPVAASCQKEIPPVSLASARRGGSLDNDLACRMRCNARLLDVLQGRVRVDLIHHHMEQQVVFLSRRKLLWYST